ncbi:hypothetical protein COO60DRAFT_1702547 [Scenedesmus sp. NREL 46B-D3]|nr:hypothetical protein COO60DRAFT_1702547 [Scenedesmus sp. NREL 46B-D3]
MAPQQQQHGLFMQGSLNGMFAGHNKQEQLAACFKDHASTAAAAAAEQAACAAAAAAVTQDSSASGPEYTMDDEPDLRHLTVMQRYHARRKLAVQRMEREVEEKLAQLALLEQENRKLKWQAHILEHMLLDIDKQLEVMAHCESTPDASQWVTLLGMGQPASAGGAGRVARTVHRMLEGAGQTSVAGWTVQDCRERWLSFLDALRPLVQEAEAAQAEYRAAQQAARPEAASGGGGSAGGGSRRPRRAAAAAAAAVIQQEAEDVLGVIPLPASRIPEPPVPAPAVSSSPGQQQQQAGDGNMQQHQFLRTQSACSGEQSQQGSECCEPAAHAWSVEGVPQPLLSQIEQLVLGNFSWLLAVMTSNPVLTYEFISMDLIDGTSPLPPQEHSLWAEAVSQVQPTLDQMQECSTCIEVGGVWVSRRCMAKVMEERAEIQESLHCSVESEMHTHTSEDVLQLNSRDAAVDRMRANVRKESVVRNMVGFYCINVLSMYQLAKLALACAPWFSMAWRVIGAMEEALAARLAAQAAQQGGGRGTAGRHATRASTRAARSGLVAARVGAELEYSGRAGATTSLVNGRISSNTRVIGQVLVLDVSSLRLTEAAAPGTEAAAAAAANPEATAAASLYVKSVQECSLHCALVPGCNAFSYCTTPTGCVNATGGVKGDANTYWTPLPSQGSNGCHPGGGWPHGMCYLAHAEDPRQLVCMRKAWQAQPLPRLSVPALRLTPTRAARVGVRCTCSGMSARACESCAGAANVAGCLACINSTQHDAASLAIRGSPHLRQPQDGCRSCHNSRMPESCMECLRNDTLPCHKCPAEAIEPNADMDTCIPCIKQHGQALASSCIGCAQSSQPQPCTACLDSAAKNFCGVEPEPGSASGVAAADEAGSAQCIGSTSPICRLCVERSNQRGMCLACSSADSYSADCEYCALEADPAAAAACYKCSATLQRSNGTHNAFCSGCLSLPDPQDKQQCLDCLASAAVGDNAKQWCLGCANASDKGRCFECLQQQLADSEAYRARCLMSRSPDAPGPG